MTPDENDPEQPPSSSLANFRAGRRSGLESKDDAGTRAASNRNGALIAIASVAALAAVIVLALLLAGVGPFSSGSDSVVTTTTASPVETTTTTTPVVKIRAFNPSVHAESQAYFVTLWTSVKATHVEITRQARVTKIDPSVSNQTALVGLEQNCTSVAATYNAAAQAIATGAFRAAGLPPQIPADECAPSSAA